MLFNTSNTGPVLEHIATSLTSLFPTRQALSNLLSQAQISRGPPHHTPGLNQTIYQILFAWCSPPIAPVPVLGVIDSWQSYLGVLPCFDLHFVEIASHDLVIPLNNGTNSPYQWCSNLH